MKILTFHSCYRWRPERHELKKTYIKIEYIICKTFDDNAHLHNMLIRSKHLQFLLCRFIPKEIIHKAYFYYFDEKIQHKATPLGHLYDEFDIVYVDIFTNNNNILKLWQTQIFEYNFNIYTNEMPQILEQIFITFYSRSNYL